MVFFWYFWAVFSKIAQKVRKNFVTSEPTVQLSLLLDPNFEISFFLSYPLLSDFENRTHSFPFFQVFNPTLIMTDPPFMFTLKYSIVKCWYSSPVFADQSLADHSLPSSLQCGVRALAEYGRALGLNPGLRVTTVTTPSRPFTLLLYFNNGGAAT